MSVPGILSSGFVNAPAPLPASLDPHRNHQLHFFGFTLQRNQTQGVFMPYDNLDDVLSFLQAGIIGERLAASLMIPADDSPEANDALGDLANVMLTDASMQRLVARGARGGIAPFIAQDLKVTRTRCCWMCSQSDRRNSLVDSSALPDIMRSRCCPERPIPHKAKPVMQAFPFRNPCRAFFVPPSIIC
ncbi:MAG: hypothetical protein KDB01_14370, partial [Planctomycetaceae bacterium]|nr:hypothetical protein [Planctomycetaceae bacterium]